MLRHVAGQMTRCAPCAPTNYNLVELSNEACTSGALRAHPRITTVLGTGAAGPIPVRSVRTNELQLPFFETKNEAYMGALHAHPRITTASPESLPGSCAGALRAHPRITTTVSMSKISSGLVRPMRTNELQRLCRIDTTNRSWCVLCTPMNHNDTLRHRYDL